MFIGTVFWVIMIVAAVFGVVWRDNPRLLHGCTILFFVLIGILGWHVFGPAFYDTVRSNHP